MLVWDIHLQDDHRHKRSQIKEDKNYNDNMYYDTFKTKFPANVNDMKYHLRINIYIYKYINRS